VPRGRGVQIGTTFGEGPPPKIWEGKKRLKFIALSDNYRLRSRISPEWIQKSKTGKVVDQLQTLPRCTKKDGELWSTNEKVIVAHADPPKLHFSSDFISARRGYWPLKFLHALEIDQGMLPHPRAALRWALPHISSFFFIFSPRDLRAPSADRRETLPHDRNMGALYNASPKIRGALPSKKWGPKTCKIRHDFRQLQTSIANISGTGQDIQNRKEIWSPSIPPAFH